MNDLYGILIVSRNQELTERLVRGLQRFAAYSAPSIKGALSQLSAGNGAVILFDWDLTGDSLEMIKEIKIHFPQATIILLAELQAVNLGLRAMNEQLVFSWVFHPFKLPELRNAIQQALRHKKAKQKKAAKEELKSVQSRLVDPDD